MFRNSALALILTAALATPALADQCYSAGQTRQMVQQGQAMALSAVLGQIKAIGQIVSSDGLLCSVGGRQVYLIDVIQNGKVIHVQVDAQSGQITY